MMLRVLVDFALYHNVSKTPTVEPRPLIGKSTIPNQSTADHVHDILRRNQSDQSSDNSLIAAASKLAVEGNAKAQPSQATPMAAIQSHVNEQPPQAVPVLSVQSNADSPPSQAPAQQASSAAVQPVAEANNPAPSGDHMPVANPQSLAGIPSQVSNPDSAHVAAPSQISVPPPPPPAPIVNPSSQPGALGNGNSFSVRQPDGGFVIHFAAGDPNKPMIIQIPDSNSIPAPGPVMVPASQESPGVNPAQPSDQSAVQVQPAADPPAQPSAQSADVAVSAFGGGSGAPLVLTNPPNCRSNVFERRVEYTGGDVLFGAQDQQTSSAVDCCRLCAALEACTHWTWSDPQCSIKHGKLRRYKSRMSSQVLSGRVTLDLYIERANDPKFDKLPAHMNGFGGAMPLGMRAPIVQCKHNPEDAPYLDGPNPSHRPRSYIVINEPRSGSSWLQEISQMHPGIKVQFELDLNKGDDALSCKECRRPKVPDSKHLNRIPPKQHPPGACGMTIFGTSNRFGEVRDLANRHDAYLVILLRLNHVAHAVSTYRHFNKPPPPRMMVHGAVAVSPYVANAPAPSVESVPWDAYELAQNVEDCKQSYSRLLEFPSETRRPAHLLFYEDLKKNPKEVWDSLQRYLGLTVVQIEDLENLERKSTKKASIYYLQNLPELQRQLADEEWHEQLKNPDYDDGIDITAAFEEACRLHPDAKISWRKHTCDNGKLVPVSA